MKGYFYPRVNSIYEFELVTQVPVKLFVSNTTSSDNKTLIASSKEKKGRMFLNADTS